MLYFSVFTFLFISRGIQKLSISLKFIFLVRKLISQWAVQLFMHVWLEHKTCCFIESLQVLRDKNRTHLSASRLPLPACVLGHREKLWWYRAHKILTNLPHQLRFQFCSPFLWHLGRTQEEVWRRKSKPKVGFYWKLYSSSYIPVRLEDSKNLEWEKQKHILLFSFPQSKFLSDINGKNPSATMEDTKSIACEVATSLV